MKKIVRHEADFGTVAKKRRASRALVLLMFLLGFVLPVFFLGMGTDEMDAVAAGVLILVPSLFYTSLLASASTGTNRARFAYRVIGAAVTAIWLFSFSWRVPSQTAAVVLTVAGIVYCLLVDVFAPHCTGKPASWRDVWGKTPDSKNALLKMAGQIPAGLNVDSNGDLWGVPTTGGSFTLEMWDAKTTSLRTVTYDVAVVDPSVMARTNASANPANATSSKSKVALAKGKPRRKRRRR